MSSSSSISVMRASRKGARCSAISSASSSVASRETLVPEE